MLFYLPDQQTLDEVFGPYVRLGLRFEVCAEPHFGGKVLKVHFGEGSNAVPVFPLPAERMQTEQQAQEWLEFLRDTMLTQFVKPIALE
jgi:hypothetical protein